MARGAVPGQVLAPTRPAARHEPVPPGQALVQELAREQEQVQEQQRAQEQVQEQQRALEQELALEQVAAVAQLAQAPDSLPCEEFS